MDITVVNISKGPHELNKEALKDYEISKLSLNAAPRLRYCADSDYIGFQIDLTIMQENTVLFKSGFLIGMAIAGWAKDLKEGLDLNADRKKLAEICRTAWYIATGIVAMQSSEDSNRCIVLPAIDAEAFCNDIILLPSTANNH